MGGFPPIVPGGLVAGRRLPPCPQLIASHGHRLKSRTPCQEPSPIPPDAFASDDDGEYTEEATKSREISTSTIGVIHRIPQVHETGEDGRCITRWTSCGAAKPRR